MYPLSQNNTSSAIDFRLHSTRALGHVIDACAPRIRRWKGSIVDGIGRCWVATQDGGATNSGQYPPALWDIHWIDPACHIATVELLRSKLVDVCDKLAQACPSVIQVSRTSNIPLSVLTKLPCRKSTNCFMQLNRRYSQTLWEVSYTAVRMPPLLKYRHSNFAHANINSTILKVALRVSCLGIAFPSLPAGRIQLILKGGS